LIDRVLVANGDVEIRYVIPTHPRGETTRFCQLRKDYFPNIVEILDVADGDRGVVGLIVALDGGFSGRTPVDGDLLWHAMAADCLGQQALGRLLVPVLREEEVDGLARLVDGALERIPR